MSTDNRGLWREIALTAATFGIYLGVGRVPNLKMHRVPQTRLDRMIPLQAWTIYPYVSLYLMLVGHGVWLVRQPERLRLIMRWVRWSNLLAGMIFVGFRTTVERPSHAKGIGSRLLRLIWRIDPPHNALPSLHTAYAVLVMLAHHRWHTPQRIGIYAWSLAIIASTLTTKQHYMLDVGAGAILAFAVMNGLK